MQNPDDEIGSNDFKAEKAKARYLEELHRIEMRYKFYEATGYLPFQFTNRWGTDTYLIGIDSKADIETLAGRYPPDNTYIINGYPEFECQYILYFNTDLGFSIDWFSKTNKIVLRGLGREFFSLLISELEIFNTKSNRFYREQKVYLGKQVNDLWSSKVTSDIFEVNILDSYGQPLFERESPLVKGEVELLRIEEEKKLFDNYQSDLKKAQRRWT